MNPGNRFFDFNYTRGVQPHALKKFVPAATGGVYDKKNGTLNNSMSPIAIIFDSKLGQAKSREVEKNARRMVNTKMQKKAVVKAGRPSSSSRSI